MNKLALLGQGINVPSTRFRLEQYLHLWRKNDISIEFYQPSRSAYPPVEIYKRPFWLAGELLKRCEQLPKINDSTLVILQRQLISTLCTLEPWIKAPVVMDVDDAIFLYRSGKGAHKIAEAAESVVCGNTYLAEHFARYNKNVIVIPTAVDTKRFIQASSAPDALYLGWSGSSSGFSYLYEIESVLHQVLKLNPKWRLLITSNQPPVFKQIPQDLVTFVPWTADNEVECIQKMSVGLMPLEDSMWTRGKCSYKMLLYMACGIPVAVSRVGMNHELLTEADVGIGAVNNDEWLSGLMMLMNDAEARAEFGNAGRRLVLNKYSLHACNNTWQGIFSRYF